MKRRILIALVSTIVISIGSAMTSFAADTLDAVSASAAYYTAESILEQDVINGMAGRAGASTLTGAKGIAFEGLYERMMNLKNIFRPGLKTRPTISSTATQADLVTQNKNGAGYIVERIQCKDTVSVTGAKNTIVKAQSGQYRGTQLVGTTEAAEAVNAEAAKQGVNVTMKDSKISTKLTSKIANKKLGVTTLGQDVLNTAASAAGVGAIIDGTIATVESIVDGDDVYDAAGHVVTSATKGAVKGAVGGSVGTLACAGLAAAGVTTGAAPVIVPIVAGGAAVYGASVGLDKLSEITDVEEKISEATETSVEFVKETAADAGETAKKIGSDIAETATAFGTTVTTTANSFGTAVATTTSEIFN